MDDSTASAVILVGPSVRSAALSLSRTNQRCIAIDQFGDQDTRGLAAQANVVSLDGVAANDQLDRLLREFPNHPVVCCGQWLGMIETINDAGSHFIPGFDQWRSAVSRSTLRMVAGDAGMRLPESSTKIPSAVLRSGYLQKHTLRDGGLGIRWCDGTLDDAETSDVIYQRWIAGKSYGATCLATDDRVKVLGVCQSIFGRHGEFPFVYRGSFGPVKDFTDDEWRKLKSAARSVVKQSRLKGVFNIDFMRTSKDRLALLEINPRWSASAEIVERTFADQSQSLLQESIRAMTGQETKEIAIGKTNGTETQWVKRIVYAKSQIRFDSLQAFNAVDGFGQIHDIPADGTLVMAGHPICTVIANGSERDRMWWLNYRSVIRQIQSHHWV